MKKRNLIRLYVLLFWTILYAAQVSAQVAINQDNAVPDPSSMLDVKSSDKGMLVPRMTSTQRDAIANPAVGLLVFDTDTESFWFHDSGGWVQLVRGWSLNGNAGTDTTNNFIGTTDAMPLDFRTNNARALRLEYAESPGGHLAPNVIAGFEGNSANSGTFGATISGGGSTFGPNTVTGPGGTISGGVVNSAGDGATIGGGSENTASGFNSTIGGGSENTAGGIYSVIGGGRDNSTDGIFATVSGGNSNTASANSTVNGGDHNTASGTESAIGGGSGNTASGAYSTIPGGNQNSVSGSYSFAAGRRAKANHIGTFVWADNTTADFSSTNGKQFLIRAGNGVGINKNDPATALDVNGTVTATAFAGDGSALTGIPDDQTLSLSGTTLSIADGNSVDLASIDTDTDDQTLSLSGTTLNIEDGNSVDLSSLPFANNWNLNGNAGTDTTNNFIGTTDAMPLDFRTNNARALRLEYAEFNPGDPAPNVVGGHEGNTVNPGIAAATISGGGISTILNTVTGVAGTIGGGAGNNAGGVATIAGGAFNVASGGFSSISGGEDNTANGDFSTIGGGDSNIANGELSTIGGGQNNNADELYSTVGGGYSNTASGSYSGIGGGRNNIANGQYSTVPGGDSNEANGDYSFAAGRNAKANHPGTFVWADQASANFSSTATRQFLIRAGNGVGINKNNPASALDVNGTVTATAFAGDGSGLSGIPDDQTLSLSGATLSIENGNSVDLSSLNSVQTLIQDADADTKIQVEESADEDIIRFDMGGKEYFSMKNGRLEVRNAGQNVFIGIEAGLNNNLITNRNVAIGHHAFHENTTGSFNAAFGYQALYANTLGGNNTAVGPSALVNNTSGYDNTAIGSQALLSNTTGVFNTAVGSNTLHGNRSGNFNSALGFGTVFNFDNLDNATAIGALAQVDQSNSLILGSIAGINSATSSTNVGIGTTAPDERLHVVGKVKIEDGSQQDGYVFTSNADGTGTWEAPVMDTDDQTLELSGNTLSIENGNSVDIPGDDLGDHNATQTLNLNGNYLSGDGDAEGIFVDADGNVGIGTSTPSARIHIDGGDFLLSRSVGTNIGTALTIKGRKQSNTSFACKIDFDNIDVSNSNVDYTAASIASFNQGTDDGDLRFSTTSDLVLAERMRITNGGRVGIGTVTPATRLDVNGTVTATGFAGDGSGLTGIPDDQTLSLSGTTLSIQNGNSVDLTSLVPIGTIQMWPTATPPTGWLICNGSNFSAATYPELNAVLGGTTLPNFEGRFPLGANFPVAPGGYPHQLGSTGGEEEHTLTVAEMPSHSHNIQYSEGLESGSSNPYSDLSGTGVTDSTGNTGGGEPHNNMPPFYVINFIIKAQ